VLLERSPIPVREQPVPVSRLGEVAEAFLTNSNIGIVPVSAIDAFAYPVGSETRSLMQWLEPPAPPGVQYRFVERKSPPR
jgi:branched-subunit amino acid aminotransferase/4-amino-4-deoxychorismate lyase